MIRTLMFLFLLLTTLCAHADEKLAKWEFDDPLRKELGGRYFGPGIAYLDLIKCSIKVNLLTNEYVHYTYHKSGGLMLIHAVEKKPRDYTLNLGLGCYTGGSLERIKKDFTRPDGTYGMSETHRQCGEENQIKVGVRLFKRITWQGIGNVKNIVDFEFPGQYTEFCLFSTTTKTPQALCNADAWNFPFKPQRKSDTYQYTYDIFERITFIDHDQLPPDSPSIPPKPVYADSPAAAQTSEAD